MDGEERILTWMATVKPPEMVLASTSILGKPNTVLVASGLLQTCRLTWRQASFCEHFTLQGSVLAARPSTLTEAGMSPCLTAQHRAQQWAQKANSCAALCPWCSQAEAQLTVLRKEAEEMHHAMHGKSLCEKRALAF